ncbi:MAG: Tetratricopeptide TPR_1 repeat-containing protein [candidate division TM6 bacterium GW2011_GWF2_38_10]|nr:MAG: Tetratricopeptide TPR_1 repeat-containing protein [candidate division TM6 bacterium GW2011_GWF2_38_10]
MQTTKGEKMKIHKKQLMLFAYSLLIYSLAHNKTHHKKTPPPKSAPSITFIEDNPSTAHKHESYARYLQACFLHSKGKAHEAFKAFQQLLAKPHPPYIYDGFFKLLFDLGQFKQISTLYQQKKAYFHKAFNKNLDFHLIVGQAYLYNNQEQEALTVFKKLATTYPDNDQIAYYTALSLIESKQYDKALEHIQSCIARPTLHNRAFMFYFLSAKIYHQQKNYDQALDTVEKSINLFPRFDRGYLFKAMLLEQQGKIKDAIAGYQQFLHVVGSEETIEKQLVQLLFAEKRYPEAAHYLKKMNRRGPAFSFDLALIEYKAQNHHDALNHIEEALSLEPHNQRAQLLKTEILLAQKNLDQACAYLESLLLQNPHNHALIHTYLLLHKAGVSKKTLITHLETINKTITPSHELLSALADLSIETGAIDQGITYYQSVLQLTNDELLKEKLRYHISYIAFLAKKYDVLDQEIATLTNETSLTAKQYNLYAFYYAATNTHLDQALLWIDSALRTAPQSPYFLDTKGLILHKMGQNNDAQKCFKSALAQKPHDQTIQKHLLLTQ